MLFLEFTTILINIEAISHPVIFPDSESCSRLRFLHNGEVAGSVPCQGLSGFRLKSYTRRNLCFPPRASCREVSHRQQQWPPSSGLRSPWRHCSLRGVSWHRTARRSVWTLQTAAPTTSTVAPTSTSALSPCSKVSSADDPRDRRGFRVAGRPEDGPADCARRRACATGCQAETISPILVDPQDNQYACSNINTTPNNQQVTSTW